MPYVLYSIFSWMAVYLFVGRKLSYLWKPGLIGVGLMIFVDYFGTKYNFYDFPKGILYLWEMPLCHLIGTFGTSILYFNWLPSRWNTRLLYTLYVSTLILGVEAIMYTLGAIVYTRWELWNSYFLLVSGLTLMVYMAEALGLLKVFKDSLK